MVPCIQPIGCTDYVPEGTTRSLIHAQREASCGVRHVLCLATARQGTLHVLNKTWLGDRSCHIGKCRGGLSLLEIARSAGGQQKRPDTKL